MKQVHLILIFILASCYNIMRAQSDDQMKLDNLKYYLTSLKDNIASMRYYTDSVKVLDLLDQIEVLTANVEQEVNNVILPENGVMQTTMETTDEEQISTYENLQVNGETNTNIELNEDNSQEGIGISKYMPFKKKFNTNLKIEFGINSLSTNNIQINSVTYPEINTGGSWYWDFALIRSARLGGKDSKVALNYGISFLKNRFKLENDVRLTTNTYGNPSFISIENAKENPKLNAGYLNIPLSLTFALSKKSKLEVGGYAGYRVHTVQKNHLKVDTENIHEQRYGRHELNNWIYGAKASIDISGFHLIGRYNFSKLFNENPNYDYNTFMIGTSFSLF